MKGFTRHLKPLEILTEEQVEAIHRGTLEVLETTGLRIEHERALKVFEKNGCKVDYDEMWSFASEIHKFLGNRPKMFPGFIGGHCVIPNLGLLDEKSLNQINQINTIFKKFLNRNS